MIQIPYLNDFIGKADKIQMTQQIAMNVTANNTLEQKTKGLIYNDYLTAGNYVILIHGKMITCFNIVDKN